MSAQRRRAKTVARSSYAVELDVRWAYRLERIPLLAVAAMVCPCGFQAWLMPGDDPESSEVHDQACADHIYMCDGGWAAYDDKDTTKDVAA